MRYKQLTSSERDQLANWKAQGVSNKECAKKLRRDKSTIGREIKRNGEFERKGKRYDRRIYSAIHADCLAKTRASIKGHGKQELKNPEVYEFVTENLRNSWSPDAISGRLKLEHPNDKDYRICPETIYQWIYKEDQLKECWFEYLRRKQTKRRKRSGRKVFRAQIPDRVSIHLRSEEINNRLEFGHWEGDTVEGKGHKDGIHTEVERVSRFIMASKIQAIKSEETIKAQTNMFKPLPNKARKTTTLDNGKENHLHTKLKNLDMQTFFADPYSSWQRGTNEHGNWTLRYFFPKGTDFNLVTEEELQDTVDEINNRPRRILGYLKAQEVFAKNLLGVALAY